MLALLPPLLRRLRPDRLATGLFVAGVAFTAAFVAADTFDAERMSVEVERLRQTAEEVVEGIAGALLAAAPAVRVIVRLAALA